MDNTDARFTALERELEPLILPLCTMYQQDSKSLTRDERKARAEKCSAVCALLMSYINHTPEFNYDGGALWIVLEKCLEIYKPQDKSFAKLFFARYAKKRVPNPQLEDRFTSDDSDAERSFIRDKLRDFICDNKRAGKSEVTNVIHNSFGKNGLLSHESRKKFLKEKYHFEEEDIEAFEKSLSNMCCIVHIDEKFMESEENLRDKESELCVDVIEKAFSMTKDAEVKRNLKYFLTEHSLETIHKDEISVSLEPYIDKEYFLLHCKDDYRAAFQEAVDTAQKSGQTIQEEAFFKKCRRMAMAKYLGYELDTWRKKEKEAEKLLAEAAIYRGYHK